MSEKILCTGAKMTAAVATSRDWATKLIQRESRGSGDTENAMRRLEARYGIPWRTFWALRYRPPSDLFVSVYERLGAAYQSECEKQERLLAHEIEIAKRAVSPFHPAVTAAENFLGQAKGGTDVVESEATQKRSQRK